MKKIATLLLALVWAAPLALHAESPKQTGGSDPMAALVPPEVLMGFREKIGLSDQQVQAIQERVQQTQQQFPEKQEAMQQAVRAMEETLSQMPIDAAEAQEKLKAVLAVEAEVKAMQIGLMVELNNQLSPEQRRIARELKQQVQGGQVQQRLQQKVQQVQQQVEKLVQQGHQPHEVAQRMEQFHKLMQQGQVEQAERLVDEVLKHLQGAR